MSCSLHFTCWNKLVLVWLYNLPCGSLANLWRFDEETKEFSAISIMLQDLLYRLFDGYGNDGLASSKCMELRNSAYVFKEEYHKSYPAYVCEINNGTGKWL